MKLVITASIKKIECELLKRIFSLEVIGMAAKKSLLGLGDSIKSSTKISDAVLKKVYLTSVGGAGRAIFLLQFHYQKSVLVMIKMKSDKQIGANMTIENSKFRKVLDKNLGLILTDLEKGDFEEYEL